MHYQVLNPAYADRPVPARRSAGLFFNVTRNDAPADLQAIFGPTGFVCTHADELLIPYGNTPLGNDPTQCTVLRPGELTAPQRGGGFG